jgi:hypothetical protein
LVIGLLLDLLIAPREEAAQGEVVAAAVVEGQRDLLRFVPAEVLAGDDVAMEAVGTRVAAVEACAQTAFTDRAADRAAELVTVARADTGAEFAGDGVATTCRDVIDRTAESNTAVEGALRPLDDFDPLEIQQPKIQQVAATCGGDRLRGDVDAVDQDADRRSATGRRQAADRRTRVVGAEVLIEHQAGREFGDIAEARDAGALDLFGSECRDRQRCLLQGLLASSSRHGDFF